MVIFSIFSKSGKKATNIFCQTVLEIRKKSKDQEKSKRSGEKVKDQEKSKDQEKK